MNIIILAAGQGKRLRPLTDDKPKCLVKYNNKPIINYIVDSIENNNFDKVILVDGYKKQILREHLKDRKYIFRSNKRFDKTNMLHSLFCAKEFFDDDLIISYSDIIYKNNVLNLLVESKNLIDVVVDKEWRKLWEIRMENPLDDAESLVIENNKIKEIGFKSTNYNQIQGQYIGLIKFSKEIVQKVLIFYNSLDPQKEYYGQKLDNMYLTTFLQLLIDNKFEINPLIINGGWLEIDSLMDLENYKQKNIKF